MKNLFSVASGLKPKDHAAKPLDYYRIYDKVFSDRQFVPNSYLEVGVHFGDSLEVFRKTYETCKIVGIDLDPDKVESSADQSPRIYKCDQTDKETLEDIVQKEFHSGIDLVIDDASHIGSKSYQTFEILFPFVKKGCFYIIEDWGTGYWPTWSDGEKYNKPLFLKLPWKKKSQIKSHSFGMVGFVKSLIDYVHLDSILLGTKGKFLPNCSVSEIIFYPGICILRKS